MPWDDLPEELRELILQHRAARTIQDRWWRHQHYGHARKLEWDAVRVHLDHIGAWPALAAFSHVRREWRSEPLSWLLMTERTSHIIRWEAHHGLWGARSPLLSQCCVRPASPCIA